MLVIRRNIGTEPVRDRARAKLSDFEGEVGLEQAALVLTKEQAGSLRIPWSSPRKKGDKSQL